MNDFKVDSQFELLKETKYVLFHNSNRMDFPSLESLKHYVTDFLLHFPDVDMSDFKVFKIQIFE